MKKWSELRAKMSKTAQVWSVIAVEQMARLEDGLLFTAGAGVALSLLGERGSGKDSEGVAVRFLNHREFNLGVNEITVAIRALQHPVRHWTRLKRK
jgi:hypothetical protein